MRKIIVVLCAILSLQSNAQCWESISAGAFHTIAIKQDFTLWGWGANNTHQLGIGNTTNKKIPILLDSTGSSWLQACAGYGHTIALKQNKTLWAWGWNNNNQLGNSTTINKSTPIQIGTDSNWQSISTGYSHSIAIKSDGTLWAWGVNTYGQLGDGTIINKIVPTQIGTDTNWQSISAGYSHSMAIKSDGTLWAWGRNNFSQLGNGNSININIPTQIGTDVDWMKINLGYYHSIALKQNGTLWAWGRNANGAVGDGTNTNRIKPIQIGTASNWLNIETGGYHSLAIKSDGTLWTWGLNTNGQLGDGTTINKNIPTQVNANMNWQTLSAGEEHSIAIKQNSTLWAWGQNNKSQLGNDNIINQLSPIVINTIVNISVCPNTLPYTWKGQTISASGIYYDTLINSTGCDSIIELNLTINNSTSNTLNQSACNSYTFNNQTITTSGIYYDTLINSAGCDSIITLNLTINNPTSNTINQFAYNSYTFNNQMITQSGIYYDTLINSTGCDSIISLNLTIIKDFITVWNLSFPGSSPNSITFSVGTTGIVNYTWETIPAGTTGSGSFSGTTATISGLPTNSIIRLRIKSANFNRININNNANKSRLVNIEQWGGVSWTSMESAFYGCNSLNISAIDVPNLSFVTNMSYMFRNCSSLNSPANMDTWNISNVTNMYGMFSNAYAFNQPIGNWNTSNVTNMRYMFYNDTSFNQPLGNWNLTALINNQNMLDNCGMDCNNYSSTLIFWANNINTPIGRSLGALGINYGTNAVSSRNYLLNTKGWTINGDIANSLACCVVTSSNFSQTNCDSYFFNNQTLTSTGIYFDTLINSTGCDSIITLNLTINSTSNTINQTICASALPYSWNGQSLSAAGTYTNTQTGANGCDSVATLNLTVNQATANTTNTAICSSELPYSWNGQSLSTAGTYINTQAGANGCDSIDTLNLTVNQATSTTNTVICSTALPYSWNGQSLITAGTYTNTQTGANGCDSTATLNLTVNQPTASTTNTSICSSALPYSWNGQNITADGIYTHTTLNTVGCDSVATLNFTVIATSTSITTASTCNSYSFNNQNLTQSGTYYDTLINSAGCDSIITLNLTINSTSNTINQSACNLYSFNNQTLTQSGIYYDTLINSAGCDSIITMNLTIGVCATDFVTLWDLSKTGSSPNSITFGVGITGTVNYTWETIPAGTTGSGSFSGTTATISGLPTNSIIRLRIKSANFNRININNNANKSRLVNIEQWGGVSWTSMEYAFYGCNSLNISATDVPNLSFVTNMSYMFRNCSSLNSPANMDTWNTSNITNMYGIFSNAYAFNQPIGNWNTSNVTNMSNMFQFAYSFNQPIGNWNLTALINNQNMLDGCGMDCNNYSSTLIGWGNNINIPNGRTLGASGIHYGTNAVSSRNYLLNTKGWTINGDIANSLACCVVTSSNFSQTTCDSYFFNNQILIQSGIYLDTLINSTGCDSIITLNLTINNSTSNTMNQSACNSYNFNNQTITSSGIYYDTLLNSTGCDSIITLNLTINNSTSNTMNQSACNSYTFNNQTITQSGIYYDTLTNVTGCDSIITLNLTINAPTLNTLAQSACNSYTFNNQTITQSGIYFDTLTNVTGCDSIITLNLTINAPTLNTLAQSACNSYTFNNQTITTSGIYYDTLINSAGCDSIITLNLTIKNSTSNTINQSACNSYTFNNQTITQSGTYYDTLINSAGCDSIITLNLTIKNSTSNTMNQTSCNSYTFNNQTLTQSGIYYDTLTNSAGCDSIITLNLTINNANTATTQNGTQLSATATGASYQWLTCNPFTIISGDTNQTYTATANGDYAVAITQNGCTDTSNCMTVNSVGINEIRPQNLITISPNPTNSIFKIECPMNGANVILYNSFGQKLLTSKIENQTSLIDISHFSKGIYIAEIIDDKTSYRVKIIKD